MRGGRAPGPGYRPGFLARLLGRGGRGGADAGGDRAGRRADRDRAAGVLPGRQLRPHRRGHAAGRPAGRQAGRGLQQADRIVPAGGRPAGPATRAGVDPVRGHHAPGLLLPLLGRGGADGDPDRRLRRHRRGAVLHERGGRAGPRLPRAGLRRPGPGHGAAEPGPGAAPGLGERDLAGAGLAAGPARGRSHPDRPDRPEPGRLPGPAGRQRRTAAGGLRGRLRLVRPVRLRP